MMSYTTTFNITKLLYHNLIFHIFQRKLLEMAVSMKQISEDLKNSPYQREGK